MSRWFCVPVLASSLLVGCRVSDNLSAVELLQEMDGIVRVEGAAGERRLAYAESAATSSWYMRVWLFWPVRPLLGFVFGGVAYGELKTPPAHVRELMEELPYETGDDLELAALAATRLAWVADLDSSAYGRLVAMDALAKIADELQLRVFPESFDELVVTAAPAQLALALASYNAGRPEARVRETWSAAQRDEYRRALSVLVARPMATPWAGIELVESLTESFRREDDDELVGDAAAALRQGLAQLVRGVVLRGVQGRQRDFVDVRLCAMEHVRRFAGVRGVPLLLVLMAATRDEVKLGEPRYDPDPSVRLRLIHYCGQLRGDAALATVRLPNREAWESISPAEFLATTILQEDLIYSKLRLPALAALTWSLGRPRLDLDTSWVRTWLDASQR
ncbi:MAG: hypothetical protein ACK501_14280 [Planctomycetota bacterium]|jgi:hypothetical protein